MSHDVEPHGAVTHHAGHVDRRGHRVQGVEVFAVGLPVPRQPGQDGFSRDVLHGLHHFGEKLPVGGLAGREGDAAVAEQGGGDAVPGDGRQHRIPADLRVEVGVQVNKSRRDREPVGADLLLASAVHFADGGDGVAVDGDIRGKRFGTRAVDDLAVPND